MKKFLLIVLLFVVSISLISCSHADYKIGVLQYVTHDALDSATRGFEEELKELLEKDGKTVEFVYRNPEEDETSLTSMASQLVQSCDLVMGNATPAAVALKSAAKLQGKNIPILFTSVTDPVDCSLVESNEKPGANVTGTSDMNPVNEQVDLIFEVKPTTQKIGFLYKSTETNSVAQCDIAKNYLKSVKGLLDDQLVTKTFSQASEISATVEALCKEVDCIYLPTDNAVASSMSTITKITNREGVFLVAGEEAMVKNGATFTYSIDYYKLGKTTGKMAYDILAGANVSEMAVQKQVDGLSFAYNKDAIKALNLSLSQEFVNKYHIELD